MYRSFSQEEKVFIVEQWAKNPNACDVRRKWNFQSNRPSLPAIRRIVEKWHATGSIHRKKGSGRKKVVVVPENIEKVQNLVDDDPTLSTRRMSLQLGIPRTSVMTMLASLDLKPYQYIMCKELLPGDPWFTRKVLRHLIN